MKKPKSRLDREQINEQEALRYKDFKKLMDAHTALKGKGLKSKIWKFLGGGAAVVAVVIAINTGNRTNDSQNQNTVQPTEVSVKQERVRPFPDIPVEYETFKVDASKDCSIKTKNGSNIMISANSLIDAMGNVLQGEVNLKYREFRDMIDVFLSGIPMKYDSAGVQQHFESAGMFELLAFQNDKPVFIQPAKMVTVKFASQYAGDQYNMYRFDEKTQQWAYLHKDSSKAVKQDAKKTRAKEKIEQIDNEITELKKTVPVKPILADSKLKNIEIEVKEDEFPEIAVYKNVKFQITGSEKIDPADANRDWDMVTVTKGANGNYLLHFERGKEIKEFSCIPVFEKVDYAIAQKQFEEKYKKSQTLIKEKEKAKKQLLDKYIIAKSEQQVSLEISKREGNYGESVASNSELVTRIFQMKLFGVYNSDCPRNLPQGSLLALDLVDSTKQALTVDKVYLVERNKNALYTYYNYDKNRFSYDPKSKNLMWGINSMNQLTIFSYANFDTLKVGKGEKRTLVMKVVNVNFKNEAQIRKYLQL